MQRPAGLLLALLLVLPAGGASAQDSGASQDRFEFGLGFDRGITYRYVQRLEDVDRTGLLGNTLLEGRIGGSLYLDGGFTSGDPLASKGWGGKVRRARVYTSGRLQRFLDTAYKFEFAVEGSDFFLNDFYLRWRPDRWVDSLQVGYFDPPFSHQNLVSSSSRALMEVAAPVAALAPGFRLGAQVSREHADPSLTWFLNLSSVGQEQKVGDASDQPLRLGGRLVWRPWPHQTPDTELLHLGLSLGYAPAATGTAVRHRARPESFLVDYVVDTGDLDGGDTQLGLEAVWQRGALAAQGELLVSLLHGSDAGDPTFWGGYAQVAYALTGEARPYDTRSALLGRLVPKSPFSLGHPGPGGFELAARLSWLDLADADVAGGRLLTLTLGPAWTWNRNVRVLAGIVAGHVSGRPDDGFFALYQTRLELAF